MVLPVIFFFFTFIAYEIPICRIYGIYGSRAGKKNIRNIFTESNCVQGLALHFQRRRDGRAVGLFRIEFHVAYSISQIAFGFCVTNDNKNQMVLSALN